MGKLTSLFHLRRSKPPSPANSPPPASPPASSELERVFAKFDTNGDGRISSSELSALLASLGHAPTATELARMMAEADRDGDGFIDLAEFVELNTCLVDDDAKLEDLRSAFEVFDVDRSGGISADELARVLRGIGEGASAAQCRRMIDGVDRDGDGVISFEEFRCMMSGGAGEAVTAAARAAGK